MIPPLRTGRSGGGLLALACVVLGCRSPSATQTVHLSAAISLKEPVEEIARAYEAKHPNIHVQIALGASGDLATQIERGAEVDLFASAADAPAGRLVEAGRATPSCVLARNSLVLIRRNDPALADVTWNNLATSPAVTRVAVGLSPSVPAGTYAESTLVKLGTWTALQPRVVRGSNVRQVLDLVARGEADVGFVYATDVIGHTGVTVVGGPPDAATPKISYPLVQTSDANALAKDFATALCGDDARAVFLRDGFLAP